MSVENTTPRRRSKSFSSENKDDVCLPNTPGLLLKSASVRRKPIPESFCLVSKNMDHDGKYGKIEIVDKQKLVFSHPERNCSYFFDQIFEESSDRNTSIFQNLTSKAISNLESTRSCLFYLTRPSKIYDSRNIFRDFSHPFLEHLVSEISENKNELFDITESKINITLLDLGVDQNVLENCEFSTSEIIKKPDLFSKILAHGKEKIERYYSSKKQKEEEEEDLSDDEDDESKSLPTIIYEIQLKLVSSVKVSFLLTLLSEEHLDSVEPIFTRTLTPNNFREEENKNVNMDIRNVQSSILSKLDIPGNQLFGIILLFHVFEDKNNILSNRACLELSSIVNKYSKKRRKMLLQLGYLIDVAKKLDFEKTKEVKNEPKLEEEEEGEERTPEIEDVIASLPKIFDQIQNLRTEFIEKQEIHKHLELKISDLEKRNQELVAEKIKQKEKEVKEKERNGIDYETKYLDMMEEKFQLEATYLDQLKEKDLEIKTSEDEVKKLLEKISSLSTKEEEEEVKVVKNEEKKEDDEMMTKEKVKLIISKMKEKTIESIKKNNIKYEKKIKKLEENVSELTTELSKAKEKEQEEKKIEEKTENEKEKEDYEEGKRMLVEKEDQIKMLLVKMKEMEKNVKSMREKRQEELEDLKSNRVGKGKKVKKGGLRKKKKKKKKPTQATKRQRRGRKKKLIIIPSSSSSKHRIEEIVDIESPTRRIKKKKKKKKFSGSKLFAGERLYNGKKDREDIEEEDIKGGLFLMDSKPHSYLKEEHFSSFKEASKKREMISWPSKKTGRSKSAGRSRSSGYTTGRTTSRSSGRNTFRRNDEFSEDIGDIMEEFSEEDFFLQNQRNRIQNLRVQTATSPEIGPGSYIQPRHVSSFVVSRELKEGENDFIKRGPRKYTKERRGFGSTSTRFPVTGSKRIVMEEKVVFK